MKGQERAGEEKLKCLGEASAGRISFSLLDNFSTVHVVKGNNRYHSIRKKKGCFPYAGEVMREDQFH